MQWLVAIKMMLMRTLKDDVSFINNCFMITGGSKAKKMKLTVKGGAAVDPDSGT